jgi:O-antigen/teichoic acid export membrane protein
VGQVRFDDDIGERAPHRFWLIMTERLRESRFVREIAALWSAQAVATILAAIQGIVVARVLGPRAYGVVGLIGAIPALVFVFFDARAADAAMRFLGEFSARGADEQASAFCRFSYTLDLAVGFISLALTALLAPWAAGHVVHAPELGWFVVILAAGLWLRTPAASSEAILITLGRAHSLGVLQIIIVGTRVGLVLGAVALRLGIRGVIWGTAIGFAVEGALMMAAATRLSGQVWGSWVRQSLWPLRSRRREIVRFVFFADLGSTLALVAKQSDVLAVGFFLNPLAAGFYRLASSLASLGGTLVGPLQSLLYQRFARYAGRKDINGLRTGVRRAALGICTPLALLMAIGVIFVPAGVRLTAGPAYLGAVAAARVMVGLYATWMAFAWVRPLVLTRDQVRMWAGVGAVASALSLAGFLLVTPAAGIVGTAWVRLGVNLFVQGSGAFFVLRRLGVAPSEDLPASGDDQGGR